MSNPILNSLNRNLVTGPMQTAIHQNPQYQQILNLLRENGGDPQRAFYALANQMGINPNDILSMLK